jgi:hypothetical protein
MTTFHLKRTIISERTEAVDAEVARFRKEILSTALPGPFRKI